MRYLIGIVAFLALITGVRGQTIIYADQEPGATADIKLNACIRAAINRTQNGKFGSGICDARGLYGTQIIAAQVNVGDSQQDTVTLLLPTFANWMVTLNDQTKCGIKQYGNSAIIGSNPGGSSQMAIVSAGTSGQTMNSLYCTDDEPATNGSYIRAEGFGIYNPSGTPMASAAMTVQFTWDNSTFKEITIADTGNIGLLVHGACCGSSFWDITSNSGYGVSTHGAATAAIPVVVMNDDISGTGHASPGLAFYSLSADHPSVGKNCVLISGSEDPYYVGDTLEFHNLFMEASETDTSTPLVQVNAPLRASFFGVTAQHRNANSTAYVFDVNSTFRSQFQLVGFTYYNDATGGAYGPVVNDHINGIQAKADDSGNLAFYSTTVSPTVRQTLTTTLATSDTVTIIGVASSSRCSMAPTNFLAAHFVGTYISSKATNRITVAHPLVAGMTFDIICTAY